VRLPRRAEVARFLAPAAFLLAFTIAVLLVRAGLEGGKSGTTTPTTQPQPIATRTTTTRAKPKPAARRFYTIQSGDTLETVAAKFGTTTQKLLALNPTIDPHALSIGQKIRIG
jgi:peptidoglycan DL-endopeptidase LytE